MIRRRVRQIETGLDPVHINLKACEGALLPEYVAAQRMHVLPQSRHGSPDGAYVILQAGRGRPQSAQVRENEFMKISSHNNNNLCRPRQENYKTNVTNP